MADTHETRCSQGPSFNQFVVGLLVALATKAAQSPQGSEHLFTTEHTKTKGVFK